MRDRAQTGGFEFREHAFLLHRRDQSIYPDPPSYLLYDLEDSVGDLALDFTSVTYSLQDGAFLQTLCLFHMGAKCHDRHPYLIGDSLQASLLIHDNPDVLVSVLIQSYGHILDLGIEKYVPAWPAGRLGRAQYRKNKQNKG